MDGKRYGMDDFCPTISLTYDAENRLVSVTGASLSAAFTYDGDGTRVKSVLNGVTRRFVGEYYEASGGTVTKYYYAGSQRVAMRRGGVVRYLLTDHLNSTALTTDAAGTVTSDGVTVVDYTLSITGIDIARQVGNEIINPSDLAEVLFDRLGTNGPGYIGPEVDPSTWFTPMY